MLTSLTTLSFNNFFTFWNWLPAGFKRLNGYASGNSLLLSCHEDGVRKDHFAVFPEASEQGIV
ncbi:MAG TPA: hypothetical protein VFO54_03855, partial [Chryseosolibacter sp.]|nr:hypothetical protein [Chryseosolibacter sp.]